MNAPPSNSPIEPAPAELGERISAYLDGEASAQEAAEIERLIAADPAARKLADGLRAVSRLCQQAPTPTFTTDLKSTVLAEALRRQSAGAEPVEVAERLEPEGDFGLPFGKASRSWMWAGVAAAAAVMIIANRPAAPSSQGGSGQGGSGQGTIASARLTPQIEQNLLAMRQAMPGLQVVNLQASPDKIARLQQRFAKQRAQLPAGLMAVNAPAKADEQLLYVEADNESELDRLLAEFNAEEGGGSLVTVASDQSPPDPSNVAPLPAPSPSQATAGVRVAPLRLKLSPEALTKLIAQQKQSGQRRFVVLRIRIQPPTPQP